jgi:hypothetical protein
MKTERQIRKEIKENVDLLYVMQMIRDDDSVLSPEVMVLSKAEIMTRIQVLDWVLTGREYNQPFNMDRYDPYEG